MTEDLLILDIEAEIRKRQREKDEAEYKDREIERLQWQQTIQKGINSLWEYCRLKSPKYFTEDKKYLKKLVNVLQALYEGRIIKFPGDKEWRIVATIEGLKDFEVCKKLMLNIPPRHGKSRSLINFCQWVFGKNPNTKIIECSYNDTVAGDFAKYTRDGIQEEKLTNDFVFSDFFPKTKIKYGSHSYYKWALEGQHFTYLGAGIGGSITGKGGDILIIDDPIKLAKEALDENRLDAIWNWYTGTFLSRGEGEGGEPLEIITMTRWAKGDLCGRILDSDEASEWYVFKLEVYDEKTDQMLCEKVLSKKRYLSLKKKMIEEIFLANYHNETVDQKGRLYKSFKTYEKIPTDSNGNPLFEQLRNYTDTADEGDDYLCSINYGVYNGEAYILDVLYTKEGMEITEPLTADFLFNQKINIAKIESNNGGRGFSRNVKRILWEKYKSRGCVIYWFHQSNNKMARIISNSAFVQEHIYFPVNWRERWPLFYKSMKTFLKEGKNQTDDAEDTITGVAENCNARMITAGESIF